MRADGHQEILDKYIYNFLLAEQEVLYKGRSVFDEIYLPLLEKEGVGLVYMTVGGDHVAQVMYSASDYRFWDAHKKLDALNCELELATPSFVLCKNRADIDRAEREGKIGVVASIDGGRPLHGKSNLQLLSSLRSLYRAGLRAIQLTGNGRNRLADGVGQARTGGKLTRFGKEVVREADRLEMILDSAQLSDAGFYSLLETTDRPLIDSHTAASAVVEHPRNISDERIRKIAERGGVIGVSFWAALLAPDKERAEAEDLIRHLDHMVKVAGIDHVGLGPAYSAYTTPVDREHLKGYANRGPEFCDFDKLTPVQSEKYPGYIEGVYYGIRKSDFVEGPQTHEKFSLIDGILEGYGYGSEEIDKITGANWLRIYKELLPQ